jgi:hypothetical protein
MNIWHPVTNCASELGIAIGLESNMHNRQLGSIRVFRDWLQSTHDCRWRKAAFGHKQPLGGSEIIEISSFVDTSC